MKKKLKPIPDFKNEDEEFEFWATHDTTEYFDYSKAKRAVFPDLKRTPLEKLRKIQSLPEENYPFIVQDAPRKEKKN